MRCVCGALCSAREAGRPRGPRCTCSARPGCRKRRASSASPRGALRSAVGQPQQQLEAKRAALTKDGLFDPGPQAAAAAYPSTLAVVTSMDGAALHDIVTVARSRWPAVRILVVGARVQGGDAVAELVRALRTVNLLGPTSASSAVAAASARTCRASTTRASAGRWPRCGCPRFRPWGTRPTSRSPISWPISARPRRPPRRSSRSPIGATCAARWMRLPLRLAGGLVASDPARSASGWRLPPTGWSRGSRARCGSNVPGSSARRPARRTEPAPRAGARLRRADVSRGRVLRRAMSSRRGSAIGSVCATAT